jgi:radical SAM superfamily enzyme YgiQ (UPF0313 family)
MALMAERHFKPNLLCIVPPFSTTSAPAGAAYLLGYLKAHDCWDFDFLDLRLGLPDVYSPTYRYTGVFAESYVFDIPDLPLVLHLLNALETGQPLLPERSSLFDRYCLQRGISPTHLISYLQNLHNYLSGTFEQIPDIRFIGFTVWTSNFFTTLLATAILKKRPNPPYIVAGGPQVTASSASAALGLRSGLFDVVAISEGEETLLDVYKAYSVTGSVTNGLKGTAFLDSSGKLQKVDRPLLPMATLPPPSFAEMNLQAYQEDGDCQTLPFQFSRGCTDKCVFCSERVLWRAYRPDTVEHAIDQIKTLQHEYGADFLIFADSLLNGHRRRLVDFAEQLLRNSIDLSWNGFMRADMDPKTAKLLARAGCAGVFVGIESFSDETLDLMNKRRTKAENVQAVEAFLGAGICVTAGFVPGFPGDKRESFIASVMVLKELQDKYPGLLEIHTEPFLLQPNTALYANLSDMNLTAKPWEDSYLDLAPQFRDISEKVFCAIEGENQGIERLGRYIIVDAIKVDEPSRPGFSFGDDENDVLSSATFDFDHIYRGWYTAKRMAASGHLYAVLVNDSEKKTLEAYQEESISLRSRRATALISKIEDEHIAAPTKRHPHVVRSCYRKEVDRRDRYATSPFVIARSMGTRNRVLVVNLASGRWFQETPRVGKVIECAYGRPRSHDELSRSWGCGAFDRHLRKLLDSGTLVVCDTVGADRSRRAANLPRQSHEKLRTKINLHSRLTADQR